MALKRPVYHLRAIKSFPYISAKPVHVETLHVPSSARFSFRRSSVARVKRSLEGNTRAPRHLGLDSGHDSHLRRRGCGKYETVRYKYVGRDWGNLKALQVTVIVLKRERDGN